MMARGWEKCDKLTLRCSLIGCSNLSRGGRPAFGKCEKYLTIWAADKSVEARQCAHIRHRSLAVPYAVPGPTTETHIRLVQYSSVHHFWTRSRRPSATIFSFLYSLRHASKFASVELWPSRAVSTLRVYSPDADAELSTGSCEGAGV